MYGIDLISGHNDCYWNFEGRCTFDKYKKHRRSGQRDFDSNGYVEQLDQAPDEALNKASVIMSAVSYWIENNDKYINFRKCQS